MTAVYLTIWLSMVLFTAGESGRAFTPRGSRPPRWAWWMFALGLALAIVHTLLAFAIAHQWSHADAVRTTAEQTQAIYGVAFGAGLYVNYLFLAVWLIDCVWWRMAEAKARPASMIWALRAFYMLIIFNAVIVFADGVRRIAGLLLVSWLARAWTHRVAAPVPSSPRPRSSEGRTVSR